MELKQVGKLFEKPAVRSCFIKSPQTDISPKYDKLTNDKTIYHKKPQLDVLSARNSTIGQYLTIVGYLS